MGGSLVKQRPLRGPRGLALFPCSEAVCPCMSPGEGNVRGDDWGSHVTHGLEQPGTAAGDGLPSICLPIWPPPASISSEPMFVGLQDLEAEASAGVTSSNAPWSSFKASKKQSVTSLLFLAAASSH